MGRWQREALTEGLWRDRRAPSTTACGGVFAIGRFRSYMSIYGRLLRRLIIATAAHAVSANVSKYTTIWKGLIQLLHH